MRTKGRYGQFIRWIFTGVDFAILNLAYLLVCFILKDFIFDRGVWMILNGSFFIVSYFYSDVHSRRVLYADQVLLQAVKTVLLQIVVFLSISYFVNSETTAWKALTELYGIFYLMLSTWWIVSRKLLKWYRTKGFNFKRIIVIGGGTIGVRLMNELESDQGYGYRIMGFFDDNKKARSVKGYKGGLDAVGDFVKDNLIDEMYCTIPDTENDDVLHMIKIAENNAVDFYYVPQFSRRITRRFELSSIGNVPILGVRSNPLSSGLNRAAKRVFDFVISSIALILSPIILIPVAIGIKLSSPGPVFFTQERTGYRGATFKCYKFRTMKVNKESDNLQASEHDPRKTKFGDFLRRSSIDELPQFFNVWKGDMSLVGPRPHMISHTQIYSNLIDKYMLRHTIKPGITGWAQVNGYRGQTDQLWKMEKRVEYDVWYAENWNFMLDIKIILLTIINVFKGDKNAY